MQDKVCIVTGGAVGLGRAYSEALSREGARVAVLDIADGSELAARIGGQYFHTDVSDVETPVPAINNSPTTPGGTGLP